MVVFGIQMSSEELYSKFRLFSFQGCTNATFSPWMEKLDTSWIIQHSLIEIDWTQNYTSVNHTHNAVIPPLVNHERCEIFHLHGTTCVTLELENKNVGIGSEKLSSFFFFNYIGHSLRHCLA